MFLHKEGIGRKVSDKTMLLANGVLYKDSLDRHGRMGRRGAAMLFFHLFD
jgi:hypothetical protein